MLIQLPEWLKKNFDLRRLHEGTVLDNNDPLMLGRVKVTVPGILEGSSSDLPWVYPMTPTFLGGGQGSIAFFVPELDSKIAVWFPMEEVYFGFYIGHFHTQSAHESLFEEDYPNSYGFKDSGGTYLLVNKTQGYLKVFHQSGSSIVIYKEGKIELQGKANILVSADGNVEVKATGDVSLSTQMGRILLGGDFAVAGVVTENSYCPLRGTHSGAGSTTVKAM